MYHSSKMRLDVFCFNSYWKGMILFFVLGVGITSANGKDYEGQKKLCKENFNGSWIKHRMNF